LRQQSSESHSLAGLVKDWLALRRVDAVESDSFFASLVRHNDRVAIMTKSQMFVLSSVAFFSKSLRPPGESWAHSE
jgi:hypothetical protein